jgi:hypothetical protein
MVRRTDRPLLQVRVSFEATRSAPHHLIEAYARLVPMVQLALAHRLAVWVSSAAWCPYVEPETTIRLPTGAFVVHAFIASARGQQARARIC